MGSESRPPRDPEWAKDPRDRRKGARPIPKPRIKLAAGAAGMTLGGLADRMGCGAETLSRYISGDRRMPDYYLVRAAVALNVSPFWILGLGKDSKGYAETYCSAIAGRYGLLEYARPGVAAMVREMDFRHPRHVLEAMGDYAEDIWDAGRVATFSSLVAACDGITAAAVRESLRHKPPKKDFDAIEEDSDERRKFEEQTYARLKVIERERFDKLYNGVPTLVIP